MTEQVYIARNYRSKFDAAGKAKMDCETILANNGWKNIGFRQTWIANGLVGTLLSALGVTWALLRLKRESSVCLQYPFKKFYRYAVWGARLKKCRLLTIVHDVASLKKRHLNPAGEIALLSQSDVLIVHNAAMATWFREQEVNAKLVHIDAFDYLHEPKIEAQKTAPDLNMLRVVFAGNMGGKQQFLYELDTLPTGPFRFDLYGVGFKLEKVQDPSRTRLCYQGKFPADEVIDRIDGDFGIVWYGDSLDCCDCDTGQYLKYNNPHKLSLYILCEMPIIIWDKAAMADFVIDNNLGFALSSLKTLPETLTALTDADIVQLKENVRRVKAKMAQGGFFADSVKRALSQMQNEKVHNKIN